ncbi:MAG: efflux RND transporter periplasmic adaptor subunit [Pseudomonadales bacterium]|nr:efflux RND transporter periplasmic adaptor subunit [Halieaceae bacterium]MCP5164631.1 efflux RND transporter periplasmic adaptor subunit [Pseudomonadales bacterium]MCP5190036.1 efflux RND transporter periplasmic adaptor subunit [Pseudomonadales bacterium]
MLKRTTKVLLPLGIVALAVAVALAMVNSRQPLAKAEAAPLLPKVRTVAVALGEVTPSIVAHGNVTARHELELVSEVSGRVEWIAPEFEPGQLVATGQVLVRIDAINYRLALAEARAALASASLTLADSRAVKRQAAIEEGELRVEAARQAVAKAEQDLAYTEIRAPFNAVIDAKRVEFGQYLAAGQPVARLLSSDTAEVSLPLPPSEAALLDPAVGGGVRLSARMGAEVQQWPAHLLRIEARVDEETRVMPVVVEVASPYDADIHAYTLPLGLFVRAELAGKPMGSAVRLPNSALQADDSVFVVEADQLQRRPVNVVHREGNSVIVSGGLDDGDQVVVNRLEVMFQGMQVERVDG